MSLPQQNGTSSLKEKMVPMAIGFVSSQLATFAVQPTDTLKVRMQAVGERGVKASFSTVAKEMYVQEGLRSFYHGLGSALLRQLTYGTIRVGLFRYLSAVESKERGHVAISKKILFSTTSGVIGSFMGSPFDVVLVRMQSEPSLPPELRRNYKNVVDALVRMKQEEGLRSFWKGYSINCVRSATMSSVMLTTNDELKERLNKWRGIDRSDASTNFIAAAVSGAACSFCSLPFDNVKTKYQKMTPDKRGLLPYSSLPDVFRKTFQREGIRGFWTGYSAFYLRVSPYTIILLVLNDTLHKKFDPNYKL